MDTAYITPTAAELRRDLKKATLAGCLSMVFIAALGSPIVVDFYLELGATDLHVGIMNAIPTGLLGLQFVGALWVTRLVSRRRAFLTVALLGRTAILLMALLPLLYPDLRGNRIIVPLLLLFSIFHASLNLIIPIWLTWMADMIPGRVLGRYWGVRIRWQTFTWTLAYLCVALYTWRQADASALTVVPWLLLAALPAGFLDLLLFTSIPEPPNERGTGTPWFRMIGEPLLDPGFRSVIAYYCSFIAATTLGGAFFAVYAIKVMHLSSWKTNLIWATIGIGSFLVSRRWGRMSDIHGHRPILVVCTALKPLVCIAFLLVSPAWAIVVLPLVFLFDSMANAGITVAISSYMLKAAPRLNRSMFSAAILALAGLCGGIASIVAGAAVEALGDWHWDFLGRTWINYHALFAVSIVARVGAWYMATRVREPSATSSLVLLSQFSGAWPGVFVEYPVGLYRRLLRRKRSDEPS